MPNNKTSLWKSVDWLTIFLFVVMIASGWVSIYGASFDIDNPQEINLSGRPGMQLAWIGLSAIIIFIIMMLDKNFFETFAYLIYGSIILLLILTIFIAPDIKGSRSWLVLTPRINIQPAEFAKFATLLALAKFMNSYEFYLLNIKNFFISVCIILLPMACIILQREAGTALVFTALVLVFYREGMSGYALLSGVCAILFFVLKLKYDNLFWHNSPLGELIVAGIILVIVLFILLFILKKTKLSYTLLGIIVVTGLVSIFLTVNLLWVAVALITGISIYLVMYSLRTIERQYALLALFAVLSLGYLFSVDFVFAVDCRGYDKKRMMSMLLGHCTAHDDKI